MCVKVCKWCAGVGLYGRLGGCLCEGACVCVCVCVCVWRGRVSVCAFEGVCLKVCVNGVS